MKQRYAFVFFLLLLLTFGFYAVQQKKQTVLFDKHLIDYIHAQKTNAFFEQADAYKYAQDYARARVVFAELLPKARNADDSLYAYNQLIYCDLAMNEDSLAGQYIEELERRFPDVGKRDPSVSGDYFYNKGVFCYRIFHPKEAEIYLQKSLVLFDAVYGKAHLKTALCLTQLGHLLYEFSGYPDSIFNYLPRAYDIFQANPRLKKYSGPTELGMVYVNFLKRSNEMGNYHCDNAIHLLSHSPCVDSITLARTVSFKGQMIKKIGDKAQNDTLRDKLYDEAEGYFLKAFAMMRSEHPRAQEVLRNLLIIYIFKKDSSCFNEYLIKLRKKVAQQGNYYAYEERLLGKYSVNLPNKSDDVIHYYTQFLEKYAHDSLVGHVLKTEAYYHLITAFGDTNSLKYNHKKAVNVSNAWLNGQHAAFRRTDNAYQDAYQDAQLASTPYSAMYPFVPLNLVAETYWQKYRKRKKLSDLKKTIEIYQLTDSLLFNTINTLENNVMSAFQNDIGNSLYPKALKAIYAYYNRKKDPRYLDMAFHFSERMKSGILFRDIELLNKQDSVAILKSELDKLLGKSAVYQLKNYDISDRITSLNRRLEKLMLLKTVQSDAQLCTIASVRQQLKPQQALIQYNLDNEQTSLHALYISHDTIQFYEYESVALKNKLTEYRNCLKDYDNVSKTKAIFSKSAYYLYQKLIQPFEYDIQKRTDLVLIPDRNLHQIPFESLITTKTVNNYQSADYLIKRPNLTLSYAPSWKIFNLNKTKKDVAAEDRLLYFTYGKNTSEIPCSGNEIAYIEKIFGTQADAYTNGDCTKKQFLTSWEKDYGILHLSLHAEGKTDSIFSNKIWFQPRQQDALYGFELTGTHSPVKLVMLLACETNVGNTDIGEGVYSIARYFFQSNTKTVVASLWQIDNCPNTQITRFFYQLLRGGQKPKQALCEAKRLFIQQSSDDIMAHPAYWAGLVCLD